MTTDPHETQGQFDADAAMLAFMDGTDAEMNPAGQTIAEADAIRAAEAATVGLQAIAAGAGKMPQTTITEMRELMDAKTTADLVAVMNRHATALSAAMGMTSAPHAYTAADVYPAAFGRLAAMTTELLYRASQATARL